LKPVNHDEIKAALTNLENKFTQKLSRVLIVEVDDVQRKKFVDILEDADTEIISTAVLNETLLSVKIDSIDCLIINQKLLDSANCELLEQLAQKAVGVFPRVVAYLDDSPTPDQKVKMARLSRSVVLKQVRSIEGLFDEVTLILHRVEASMSQNQKQMIKSVKSRDQAFKGRKILLVDDDIRNIFAMTSALEEKGATIYVGRNGQEALDQLDQDPKIDLVLMDIMMPEMDGYEATRRIRKQKRFAKLPIIAVTAKAMIDDQEKCLEAGTNDYVSKPVDLDKLQSLIRVWITQ
jgi:CheY-like chemotaxis protein